MQVTKDLEKRPPRDYQRQCVDFTLKSSSQRGYYTLPTGTGKTRVLTMIVERILEGGVEGLRPYPRVLLLVHRREIVYQIRDALLEDLPDYRYFFGIVMGKVNDFDSQVIIATWQSFTAKRLEQLGERFDYILIDECHHVVPGSAYERIILSCEKRNPNCRTIGCTATPYRADKLTMQSVLPDCFFSRTIPEMQEQKWLSPIRWKAVKLPSLQLRGLKTSTLEGEKDFRADDLYDAMREQTAEIVAATAPHFGTRPVIVFAVNVRHAYELSEAYSEAGFESFAVD